MALAGREERAGQVRNDHSCSVYEGSRVQNGVGPIVCRNLRRSLQNRITSSHARVSAAELAPIQAKVSRNFNQIARGRIRQFES
jgi:hypothetical protein